MSRPEGRYARGIYTDGTGARCRVVVSQTPDDEVTSYQVSWVDCEKGIEGGVYQSLEAALQAAEQMEPSIEWFVMK